MFAILVHVDVFRCSWDTGLWCECLGLLFPLCLLPSMRNLQKFERGGIAFLLVVGKYEDVF